MKLFEMKHIKKSFDGLEVLKDISLDVEEGEVLSIIGPSGSVSMCMITVMKRKSVFTLRNFFTKRPLINVD